MRARIPRALPLFARGGYLALRIAAAGILLVMMGLTVVDVVMRYWFNSSVEGAFEITQLLLVVVIFAGFPLVSQADQHVSVDVLERLFTDRVRRGLDVFRQVVGVAVLGTMSWLLWDRVNLVIEYEDVTAALELSVLPVVCVMFALAVVTTLIHVSKLVGAVKSVGGDGSTDRPADPGSF